MAWCWRGAWAKQDKAPSHCILLRAMGHIPSLPSRSPAHASGAGGFTPHRFAPQHPVTCCSPSGGDVPDPQEELPMIPLPVPCQDPLFPSCSRAAFASRRAPLPASVFLVLLTLPGAQGTNSTFQGAGSNRRKSHNPLPLPPAPHTGINAPLGTKLIPPWNTAGAASPQEQANQGGESKGKSCSQSCSLSFSTGERD